MKKIFLIIGIIVLFIGAILYQKNDIAMRAYANGYMQCEIDNNKTSAATNFDEFYNRVIKSTKWYSNKIGYSYSEKEIRGLIPKE